MSTYETRLQKRKVQFVERARLRLARTAESLQKAARYRQGVELWREVTKEFHQLAAGAGIYEMSDLADLAVQTEDMLIAAQKDGATPGKQEVGKVLDAIQAMERILAAVSPQNADVS